MRAQPTAERTLDRMSTPTTRMRLASAGAGLALLAACTHSKPQTLPSRDTTGASARPAPPARDPELDARMTRFELRLLEKEAQVEELQARLDDARQEVVRALAKLQTVASRAEAASGIAEAEIALQSLKTAGAAQTSPEIGQATRLMQESSAEFDKSNYGGALYLANQAKAIAGAGRDRLATGDPRTLRTGEVAFALPLKLEATGHANVREGPGGTFKVVYTLEAGADLTAYSYVDEWVRVGDENGRIGWIFHSLVGKRSGDN